MCSDPTSQDGVRMAKARQLEQTHERWHNRRPNASGAMTADALEQRVVRVCRAARTNRRDRSSEGRRLDGPRDAERRRSPVCVTARPTCSSSSRKRHDEGLEEETGRGGGAERNKGRSGGQSSMRPVRNIVSRCRLDPGARIADSQAAKMRTAKTMQKTNRRRGRG